MTPHEIADAIWREVDERGWCKLYLWRPDGRVCTTGAYAVAASKAVSQSDEFTWDGFDWKKLSDDMDSSWHLFWGALSILARREIGIGNVSIWTWNDVVAETPEDVHLMLKKAAAFLEEV